MAGHAASSMLDIVPESQAATVGSSGPSDILSTPPVNSHTAVQYLNATSSPVDTRATGGSILESMTPANAAAITARSVNTSSRTVRWNWVNYLRSRWQQISRSSKVLLVITIALSVIQIIASIVAVAVSDDGVCDKPLKIFLIVYAVRVLLSFPFAMYQYLHPRRRRRTRRRHTDPPSPAQTSSSPASNQVPQTSQTNNDSSILPTTTPPATQPTSPIDSQSQSRRRLAIGSRIDRAKSLLDLFATFWFVVGNYFLFGSTGCSQAASALFYVTLTWVILGYIMITIPILFCAAAIFCLPCVLVGMRIMQVGEPAEMGGASPEEIQKIPVLRFTFHSDETTSIAESHISIKSTGTTRPPDTAARVGFFRRMLLRKARQQANPVDIENSKSKREYPTISFDYTEDSVCAICLSNYEQDELICRLWCKHHFHKDCLHEWLALNSMCPMCKQDSRGKEYETVEEDED